MHFRPKQTPSFDISPVVCELFGIVVLEGIRDITLDSSRDIFTEVVEFLRFSIVVPRNVVVTHTFTSCSLYLPKLNSDKGSKFNCIFRLEIQCTQNCCNCRVMCREEYQLEVLYLIQSCLTLCQKVQFLSLHRQNILKEVRCCQLHC